MVRGGTDCLLAAVSDGDGFLLRDGVESGEGPVEGEGG